MRNRDEKRQVHDGLSAESRKMLGGFFVIDVPNLDLAPERAAITPSASYGSTKVRPVLLPPPAA